MMRKGSTYYIVSQLIIFVLFSVMASRLMAFNLVIGESQINSMLALTFPYETRMGNSLIRLTDPKPHFYEASQEIGLTLNISLKDQNSGQTSRARVRIRGGVHFDNQQQQLQLVKPKIASLDWVDRPAGADQDLVKQVNQLVGQALPIIILFDIKQITGDALAPSLSDIRIKAQGIEVSF